MTAMLPPFDCIAENVFEAFVATVIDDVHELAERKHVYLAPAEAEALADGIADRMPLIEPLLFMREDPIAQIIVWRAIGAALDCCMLDRFETLYAELFVMPDNPCARRHMRRMLGHLLPRDDDDTAGRWPPLTAASFAPHLDTRTQGLVMVWDDAETVSWHRGFLLDRPSADGPALTVSYRDGRHEETYWRGGALHRDPAEGAAIIGRVRSTGPVILEEYHMNGRPHRDVGPALITYCPTTGRTMCANYYRDGVAHRDDGPASVIFDVDGTPAAQYWYADGQLHRDGAPAIIERGVGGDIVFEAHWQHGVCTCVTVDTYGVHNGG